VLIAQVTDCHIGFDPADPEEDNVRRLRAVLARLTNGPNRPDLLLLTGDLTNSGDPASFARLAGLLAACPIPARLLCGNWDERGVLLAQFPDAASVAGFVQFEMAFAGLRLIALDTTEPGRHGGAFCAARAAWLSERLDADPGTPVLIAMHHPPIVSGIDWMDGTGEEPWIARFRAAIEGRAQVRAIISGHLHRSIHTTFAGVPLIVCPSSAPAVTLDLNRFDPAAPDGRPMVVAEPPGYALHRWDGARLVTYFEAVPVSGPWEVLARFDGVMQRSVRKNADERSGKSGGRKI
jgi:3',5'-cyclic AMP phosphodiesterase CpdA